MTKKRGNLNILLIRQAYLIKKLCANHSDASVRDSLFLVQSDIKKWYTDESQKIQDQCRKEEFISSESTSIYHHLLHQQSIKKSTITKLETELGLLEGHSKCASYLEAQVHNLIGREAILDNGAQESLLQLVSVVFSNKDNEMLEAPPTVFIFIY